MGDLVKLQKEDIVKVQNNYKVKTSLGSLQSRLQIVCSLIRNKQVVLGAADEETQETNPQTVNLSGEFF